MKSLLTSYPIRLLQGLLLLTMVCGHAEAQTCSASNNGTVPSFCSEPNGQMFFIVFDDSATVANNLTVEVRDQANNLLTNYNWSNEVYPINPNYTRFSFDGFVGGNYNVTISYGTCTLNRNVTIPSAIPGFPSSFAIDAQPFCAGDSTGQVTVTVGAGTFSSKHIRLYQPDGSILRDTAQNFMSPSDFQSFAFTNLTNGAYRLAIESGTGCIDTFNFDILPSNPLSLTAAAAKPLLDCHGDLTELQLGGFVPNLGGSNLISITRQTNGANLYAGPVPNSTPVNVAPGDSFSGVLAGIDTGTYVVDHIYQGCSISDTVVINQPSPLTAFLQVNQSIGTPGGTNGELEVVATGGAAPYTYQWAEVGGSNLGSNSTQANLSAGAYTVTVTDDNGCTATDTLALADPQGVQATLQSVSNNICQGQAVAVGLSFDFPGNVTQIRWYKDGATWSELTNESNKDTILISNAGTYYSITSSAVGSDTDTIVLTASNPAASFPETDYGNGEWLAYRYQGGTFQTYLGRDTLQRGLSFSESFTPNSTHTAEFGGCPVDINGGWSTRYRRTETLQAGQYRVKWSADRYARVSFDGGASWTITVPNLNQVWTNPTTGPVDLVLEYRDNDDAAANSFDFSLDFLGVANLTQTSTTEYGVNYYQGGPPSQPTWIGRDTLQVPAAQEIVIDWDLTARGAAGGQYQPEFGQAVDLSQPYWIEFRRTVQLDPRLYLLEVNAYGERMRWAWNGTRFWNWVSNIPPTPEPWGRAGQPYDFALQVQNDGGGNHRTLLSITPTTPKLGVPTGSGLLGPQPVQLSLYPNPANSSFQVELSQAVAGDLQLSLLDLQGKSLLQQTFTGEALRGLPLELPAGVTPGVYLVQVQGVGLNETLRLVVL